MANVRFDQFVDGGEMRIGDIPVGLRVTDLSNNYKFNFPGSGIKDSSGNYLFQYETVGALAVNFPLLINSISGNSVTLTAGGTDPNIGIIIRPLADGVLTLDTLTWPTSDGIPNSFLFTDGLGNLHFTNGSVITSITGTLHQILVNGTSGVPVSGNVTLTTPQDIDTTSSPTFDAPIFTAPLLGTPASGILTNCTGLPLTTGVVGILPPANGGTGVNNGSSTLTLGGDLTTSGTFISTFVMTGNTNVTFPTSGTLATTSQLPIPSPLTEVDDTNVTMTLGGSPATALLQPVSMTLGWTGQLSLTRGGTNASLTASNGGIVYSTATALAILSSTASASLVTDSLGIPTFTSSMTDGQIVIGSTSATPISATLTAGTNISIINAPGSITINTVTAALTKIDDTNVTMTLGGSPATALLQPVSMTLGWTGQLSLTRGGTNASLTASNGGIVYSTATALAILSSVPSASLVTDSTGIPIFTSTMTNGQVVIGSTGNTPVANTLTAGTNITITNAPGSITINAVGAGVVPSPLTKVNDTNVTMTLGGSPATALLQPVSMTLGWTGQLSLTRGGTNANLTAVNGGIVYSTASALAITTALTNGQVVIGSTGGSPVPATLTAGSNITITNGAGSITISAAGSGVTPSALTKVDDTNITITLGGTPSTALLQPVSLTMGWTGTLSPARGGTGINNGTSTITLGGSLTTSGTFSSTFTMTGTTTVTFPTTGTLATTSQLPIPSPLTEVNDTNVTMTLGGSPATALLQPVSMTLGWTGQLSLTRGGTNASLTASNGGIVYSNATALAILSGTVTARQMLQSGSSAAPSWSTATWPATTTINQILYSSATNTVTGLSTANSAVLVTNSSGVPAFTSSLTNGQIIIGSTGGTPTPTTLTAGSGITITNGAGSITIAATASSPTGTLLNVQVFKTSGTYTPTSGLGNAIIVCIGGGGGGGGSAIAAASGSGGGAGSYSQSYVTSATIGASQTVTIGAGGTGVGGANGNNGGDTSVGTIVIAKGGSGGTLGSNINDVVGGAGGIAGTGNIALPGNAGGAGIMSGHTGQGGGTTFGGSPLSVVSASNGNSASNNTGAGGSGSKGGASNAGGNGGSGIVIIYEYS